MVEKVFRIISNSESYLNAEVIAMALLKEVTLKTPQCSVLFAVSELEGAKEVVIECNLSSTD